MSVKEGQLAYHLPKGGGQQTVIVHSVNHELRLAQVAEPGADDPDALFEVNLDDLRPE